MGTDAYSPKAILRRLAAISKRVAAIDEERSRLMRERDFLVDAGRNLSEPLSYSAMADASGVTRVAITMAHKRAQVD